MKALATLTASAAIALPMLLPSSVDAATIDTMSASFGGTVGGTDVNRSVVAGYGSGAAFLNWGTTARSNPSQQSGIVYRGVSLSGVDVHDGLTASIGTVWFRNQTIENGAIRQTTLNVGIVGGDGGNTYRTNLSWTFNVNETLNTLLPKALGGSCSSVWSASGGCGDVVTTAGVSTSDVVTIAGQKFKVDIAGFMKPGAAGPMETFLLYENSVKTADLMISFSQLPDNGGSAGGGNGGGGVAPVPVPAALPLFLSALGGLGAFGYRRRNKA
ncbi:MAG: VPLPA-CTERM sorting domain-containing protein [Rhodospirillales bacterium]|nr:VPLPA-CTERM sorting domain-containing protein [Rhodospirillales bacterium]